MTSLKFWALGMLLMPLEKLLKYRLNLNRFEDRNVIFYCRGDHDAINISHERSCHSSDMEMVLASSKPLEMLEKCHLCHSKSYHH